MDPRGLRALLSDLVDEREDLRLAFGRGRRRGTRRGCRICGRRGEVVKVVQELEGLLLLGLRFGRHVVRLQFRAFGYERDEVDVVAEVVVVVEVSQGAAEARVGSGERSTDAFTRAKCLRRSFELPLLLRIAIHTPLRYPRVSLIYSPPNSIQRAHSVHSVPRNRVRGQAAHRSGLYWQIRATACRLALAPLKTYINASRSKTSRHIPSQAWEGAGAESTLARRRKLVASKNLSLS